MAVSPLSSETVARSVRIQSVDRAVDLLRAVAAAHPTQATAPALAMTCGLNRATAWRLLKTLEARGMVCVDRSTGRYCVGLAVVEIASAASHGALIALARPVLARACQQTGETAAVAVPGVGCLTYVDEVTPHSVLAASWLGRSVPVHATSTGKALLAALPPHEAQRMIDGPLTAYTDTTITEPGELDAEVARTRARGYGTCRGELEKNLNGVSAPVLGLGGRPLAVVSIWGPSGRVREDSFERLGAVAVRAAAEVAAGFLSGSRA